MSGFPRLLSPVQIGAMPLRNRLVMSPMETLYGTHEGLPTQRTCDYFEARARGGVGLITLGATSIDPRHPETPGGLQIGSADALEAHRTLVEVVHAHGAKIQPQIAHAGPDGLGPQISKLPSLGPSVIPSYLTGTPSQELTVAQFQEILDLYRAAVRRVAEAGYDGIELHAAHGYMLLGSFLAPQRNRRHDDYTGNTPEGRLRATLEVLAAIRSETGDALPITLRVSGYERVAGGRPLYDTQRIAPRLVEAGVDAFHVSGGVIDRFVTQMVNGSHYPDALNVGAAAAVKQVVDVPVMAVGRIHDPKLAERILREGNADLIAMGRPLLADPELPNKLRAGEAARVRRCISCQNCIDAMESRSAVDCAVNPQTGRERELAIAPAMHRKHVVVVGGGPGGLEAARVAALRGHRVSLYERGGQLGGALVWACIVHPDNEPFLHYLRGEVARSPIEVRLREELSADDVVSLAPDAVIVATGGRIAVPRIPGDDLPLVRTGLDLRDLLSGRASRDARLPAWQRMAARMLAGRAQRVAGPRALRSASRAWLPLGRRVTIVGADLAALELAEFLAARGRRVAVLERGEQIAPEVGWKRRTEHMDRLDRLGVTVNTGVEIECIRRAGVVLRLASGREREIRADHVVLAGEVESDLTLFDALRLRLPEVHAVGDCTGLGLIQKATAEAARAACAI
ncbi:MAG: FAD-dependent oxidoreductase [Myxococcota bacterium]|nr:FAD-dependent oxidoreductase [Myxococcota bacterium]